MKRIALLTLIAGTATACSDSCFVAATLVATPLGPRRLDQLAAGDEIWSYDHAQGERVKRRLAEVHRDVVRTICNLQIGEHHVRGVTPSHPFFAIDRGEYVALRDLKPDEGLLVLDGDSTARASVRHLNVTEVPEPTISVYNLTVDGPEHNYFADGVLVHNKETVIPANCGDGYVHVSEECDDGNTVDDDACNNQCELNEGSGGSGSGGAGGDHAAGGGGDDAGGAGGSS